MDVEARWSKILGCLQDHVRPEDIDIWFKDARLVRVDGRILQLQVANRYYADWIRDNYGAGLRAAVNAVYGAPLDVGFIYADDPGVDNTAEIAHPLFSDDVDPTGRDPRFGDGGRSTRSDDPRAVNVNPVQTFASFVVGDCNRFAHAAALAVVDNPANHYNPLFIYGDTGLGKTHLMQAIGNEILRRDPAASVVYVTAEDFTNEMINSIRFKRTEEFRARYRQRATVLLVDDIQFLSGKERTQEEFFHTFNALQSSGRQVVITSDVVPKDIRALEPRLRTRFEGGLMADMQPPDNETMVAILQQKAESAQIALPHDLAHAIASVVKGSVRELEGVVNKFAALKRFFDEPLTLEFARRHLPKLFVHETPSVTVPAIIEAVARFNNLRSADITGKKRTRTLTGPRHVAMYLARLHTQLSFPELGREFGGRDHSTIQHGCRKVEEELETDAELGYQLRLIEQSLNLRHR